MATTAQISSIVTMTTTKGSSEQYRVNSYTNKNLCISIVCFQPDLLCSLSTIFVAPRDSLNRIGRKVLNDVILKTKMDHTGL